MTARAFIIPSTALSRLKRRARWIVKGVETDVTVSEYGTFWRVHLRGVADSKVFVGQPIRPGRFFVPSDAHLRLVTIMPQRYLSWRSPVWTSIAPISMEPERVVTRGVRDHKVFCDVPMGGGKCFVPSDAWARIYERYAINDGSGEVQRRRPVQFMGTGRYGFPPYTAWVAPSLRNKRSPWAAGDRFMTNRYWLPHDGKPVQRARTAVLASKKLVDRMLLELGPIPRFVVGRPFLVGIDRYVVGQP